MGRNEPVGAFVKEVLVGERNLAYTGYHHSRLASLVALSHQVLAAVACHTSGGVDSNYSKHRACDVPIPFCESQCAARPCVHVARTCWR